jgi:alkylation response protein AidB-like acyl-CoA dehydrogenase
VVGVVGPDLVMRQGDPPGFVGDNHAAMPIAERSLDGAARIGAADGYGAAVDEWRLLTAGALVGVAARALELGVDYVKERHQFGVPIGSFQALQHLLADLPGMIDGGRLLTHKAAAAADADGTSWDTARLAAMAFLFATQTAQLATDRSLHVHGGYGYTVEYDIQLYHRRARGWPLVLDDPAREHQRLADLLIDGPTAS